VAGRLYSNPAGYVSQSLGNWSASYGKPLDEPFNAYERAILGNYRLVTVA
jgi:hypothetical protein